MPPVIRPVTETDLTACHCVEALSFPEDEAASLDSIRTRIDIFPDGFLVAEDNGRIIGMVNSGSTSKDDITDEDFKSLIGHEPDGENIVVFSLCVLPEYRGNGIAADLLAQFVEHSRSLGKRRVLLLCKDGLVPFYRRAGFTDRGISSSTHGGAVWHEMVKDLTDC